jgi:hypothetical protein
MSACGRLARGEGAGGRARKPHPDWLCSSGAPARRPRMLNAHGAGEGAVSGQPGGGQYSARLTKR